MGDGFSSKKPSDDYGQYGPSEKSRGPVLLVLGVLFVSVSSIIGMYFYEGWRNEQVLEWKAEAEGLAYDQQWSEAMRLLDRAADARPEYEELQRGYAAIEEAEQLDRKIDDIAFLVKEGNVDEAQGELDMIIEEMEGTQNELLFVLKKDLKAVRQKLIVKNVQLDIEEPLSMQALAGKLLQLSDIQTAEAEETRDRVRDLIANTAVQQASDLVSEAQFSEALDVLEIARGYTPEHPSIEEYEKTVELARLDYQNAEYDRIQEAIEQAQEEDRFNRTEAVHLVSWDVTEEDDGFVLSGNVENRGTRPISKIEITWGVFNDQGTLLFESVALVEPGLLEPNGKGTFSDRLTRPEEGGKIEITDLTWYLQ